LLAYLAKVDASLVDAAKRALTPFAAVDSDATYPQLPADVRRRTRTDVDALVARLDASRDAYVKRSSESAWATARQLARIVQQAERSYGDYAARDAFMAENVAWLVAHHEPGTRFVLDAHNGHIAAENHGLLDMGRRLREQYGKDYVTIGFAFGEGSFRALDRRPGVENGGQHEFSVGRPPADTLDAALFLAGLPSFVVDLRSAPAPIAAWLRSPQRMHHVSGLFRGPDAVFETYAPSAAFDAVIYEDRITGIHSLPRGSTATPR
jgi:erythromycin esterase